MTLLLRLDRGGTVAIITGTSGNDILTGTSADDEIVAWGGMMRSMGVKAMTNSA